MLPRCARIAKSQALKSTTPGGHVSCQSALKVLAAPLIYSVFTLHTTLFTSEERSSRAAPNPFLGPTGRLFCQIDWSRRSATT